MERNKKIIQTSILGIVVNVILVIFKAIIGILSNSIAIILDAVNNSTDTLSSIITIIGTKLSNKLPDKKHPYGHGRIEYFTSVIISAIVLWAGAIAGKESIEKIIHPQDTNYTYISFIVITVSVIVKFVFGKHVKKVGKELNSRKFNSLRARCIYGFNFIFFYTCCSINKLFFTHKFRRFYRFYYLSNYSKICF